MTPLILTTQLDITGDCADAVRVWQRFIEATNRLPGTTVIASLKHDFPGGGFSGLILLGESHTAIHTFPEHRRAWVELATCGDPAALPEFERRMSRLLEDADDGRTP
jgi:S-adenosylmethionine/arginine decarboxylase-like enzyme